jgi:monoamine oxidase
MAFVFIPRAQAQVRPSPKVVVVGAGLAGLTTAYRLYQQGVHVSLYEAQERVGGRIFTVMINETPAELGGQNIADGGKAENISCLAGECALEIVKKRLPLHFFYFTGNESLSLQQLLKHKQFHPELLRSTLYELAARFKNMREVVLGVLKEDDPLCKAVLLMLAAYEGAPAEHLSTCYVKTLYHMLLGGLCAAHQGSEEEEHFIDFASIEGGNGKLVENLAKELAGIVHLNMPLKKVAKEKDGSFTLTFSNEKIVHADILVLAIPCSTYEKITFEENCISADRLEAIKSIRYGTNAKIVIPVSKKPVKRISFLDDHVIAFLDADYTLLTAYYTGATSLFSQNTLEDAYSQQRPMLEQGFQEALPPFAKPVYAGSEAFAKYSGAVGYSWPNDPYTKGSYAYISPGQEGLFTTMTEEDGEQVKALFAPIDHKIYFAGEHASTLTDVPGTMEAACQSGELAARCIIKQLQKNSTLHKYL